MAKTYLGFNALSYAHQPNCKFNADAHSPHAFGMFMGAMGARRPLASGAG